MLHQDQVNVKLLEKRTEDVWFDFSLRQLRKGEVKFYRVKDPRSGEWIFKTCRDMEQERVIVKAIKCPQGPALSQLEGNTMLFQRSAIPEMYYDIISLTQIDENGNVRRKAITAEEEIPQVIKEKCEVKTYEEATGKQAPGKHFVTLCRGDDEKAMITLFLMERAWPIAPPPPEEPPMTTVAEEGAQKPQKREIDTGQVWTCPICSRKHRLIHIETEKAIKHSIRKHVEEIPKI